MLRDAQSAQSASEVNVESCRKVGRKQNVAVRVLISSKDTKTRMRNEWVCGGKKQTGIF